MTTLKHQNNIQADGIRDTFLNTTGNGSTASTSLGDTKIWERQPIRNGSQNNNAAGTTNTSPNQCQDFGGSFKFISQQSSYSVTSTKTTTTFTFTGWFTGGGLQAASDGNLAAARGTLYDGSSTFFNTAKAVDTLNGSLNGNKWISGIGQRHNNALLADPVYTGYIVFEGAGASTTDTDWTSLTLEWDIESTGGQSLYDTYLSSAGAIRLNRTDASRVVSRYSRVVYEYDDQILAFLQSGSVDFVQYCTLR